MILHLQLSPSPIPPRAPKLEKSQFTPSSLVTPASSPGLVFREKLLYLENTLQIDSSKALSSNPTLRWTPLSTIESVTSFLSSHFHISPLDSSRIFQMYPHLLTCHPHTTLLPVFNFLKDVVGIRSPRDLRRSVLRCPRLLVSDVHSQLLPTLYFLRRLGFSGLHRIDPHTTLLLVCSVERTLIPKLDYICSLGFSYRETARMVLRSPGLLTFSIENNFKPKVEFLTEEMGREVGELKGFPQYFSFSLEGKIRPRHRELVDSGVEMGLAEMLKVSNGEFCVRVLERRLKMAEEGMEKRFDDSITGMLAVSNKLLWYKGYTSVRYIFIDMGFN